MAASEEQLLSLEDVAGRLQVSDQTVRRWIKSGKLAAYKPGLEWRIKPSDLDEFLQSRSFPKGPSRSSLEPTLFNGLNYERHKTELARTYRAAAAFGRTVVESFKNFRPLDLQRLAAFHQLESALFTLRGRRDLFGRLPEDLAYAIDDLEEISALVAERLNEHLDTSPPEERQKFEQELRELERITA